MKAVEIIFWVAIFIVFYTYIGYGILMWILVHVKEIFHKPTKPELPDDLPEVTLLIAAYNEELVVQDKMANCLSLMYPADKLKIVWITDGSTDSTNELLAAYPQATVLFEPQRGGKAAAFNRAMTFIHTPITVYTDANTMLNPEAVTEIVLKFTNPKVGCVAGEKRVSILRRQGATAGEGIYWQYESTLKNLDCRLYSAVGAAGELFAVRTELYEYLPSDTLLDDFVLSLKIAGKGYKIAYCKEAYAVESGSANMKEEAKRKVRISAGGLQSIWRLRELFNVFRYGVLTFQFVSHRVLRWSVAPVMLFVQLPLNIILVAAGRNLPLYGTLLALQILFYLLGLYGYALSKKKIKNKLTFIPYYFLFMNINVIRGVNYLRKNRGKGTWEKAGRG